MMTARLHLRLAVAFWSAVLGVAGLSGFAADPPKAADPLCPENLADGQFAIAACATCHSADPAAPQNHRFARTNASHEFILLSEGGHWDKHDPHSVAFKALQGEQGKRMSEALKYDVTKASQCLTCHAVDKLAGDTLHADALTTEAGKRFATVEGVACIACHGVRKGWQTEHYEDPNATGVIPWRGWLPAEKVKQGMRDLRDPVAKAKLCATCHVGSAELGRVVTHDMYVAGHPPLPPFELATFQKGQSRHWAHPTKLKFFDKMKAEDLWAKYHVRTDEVAAARDVAVGGITVARAEAGLLRADAERALKDGDGLDFARFDCVSCHHDLKYPGDRQNRPREGPPGRPPLRVASRVLAEVVAGHAAEFGPADLKAAAGGFVEKWAALRKAATDRPFGDAAKVKAAAADVEKWCGDFLKLQSNAPAALFPPEQAAKLRERLGGAAGTASDPEAAMVLAWAYLSLGDKPLLAEAAAKFEKVLPATVRADGALAKDPLGYADRQKKLNAFGAADFRAAFESVRRPK